MKYDIRFTPDFELDLAELEISLFEYPKKAKRIIEKIDKIILKLVDMPQMYPIYEDFPIFRKIVVEDYLIFYLINEEKKCIEIHRLIYGKMNIKNQLL